MQFASTLSAVDASPRPPTSPFSLVPGMGDSEAPNTWPLPNSAEMSAHSPSSWLHVTPAHMPWGTPAASQPSIMRFTAENLDMPGPSGHPSSLFGQCKRKIDPEVPFVRNAVNGVHLPFPGVGDVRCGRRSVVALDSFRPPPKQLITEEKMAAHMRQLHISPSYTSHEQPASNAASSVSMEAQALAPTIAAEDKAFKRLVLCEEIRQLQHEPLLPISLLQQMERPSMALVLWQPPAGKMSESLSQAVRAGQETEEEAQRNAPTPFPSVPLDNNNTSTVDLNSLHRFGQGAFSAQLDTQEMDM